MKLLIASTNRHKIVELRELLGGSCNVEVVSAAELEGLPEVAEDGSTFAANALKKSRRYCDATGLPTLADDSGLEVDILGGEPGIYSARYAGGHGDDAKNRAKLFEALGNAPMEERGAQFHCAASISMPDGRDFSADGICRGKIAFEERGEGGFGYDCMFIPDEGDGRTFSEISQEEKNAISHRGKAMAAACGIIAQLAREQA